jgi:FkbM family methyltransferase
MIRKATKRALRKSGFELRRYQPGATYLARRMERIAAESIDLVVDVGAHAGEYAGSLRHEGYKGPILSFEPQAQMYERLLHAAAGDPHWECRRQALGASPGTTTLHIAGNDGFSSSVLPMTEAHQKGEPSSTYVAAEEVEVTTLDAALGSNPGAHRLCLKIDVQGHEAAALAGGASTLARCRVVELELGLVELYEGQALFAELVGELERHGLVMADVEPAFNDRTTGQLLQVDALFIRPRGDSAGNQGQQ